MNMYFNKKEKKLGMSLNFLQKGDSSRAASRNSGFTIIEVSIVSGLSLILFIATLSSITFLDQSTRRLAEYTAATAIAQGALESIRAQEYNPPLAPFTSSETNIVTEVTIALDKADTEFLVPCEVVTHIEPIWEGHYVSVSVNFEFMGKSISMSVESVVNEYSSNQ